MTENTTQLSPHATFWLIFFALALMALLLFSEILLPFAAGMVLAYLFHPLVNGMCRLGTHRGAAAFAIIAGISLIIVLVLALILPPVLNQLSELVQKLPDYLQRARAYVEQNYGAYLQPVREHIVPPQQQGAQPQAEVSQQLAQNIAPWLVKQLQSILASSLALFNSMALLFLTPIITFFLLRDWDIMVAEVDSLLPRKDAPVIRELAEEINWTISGYLRGTLIVLVIVAGFYMVTLGLIGLNYGLLIGLGAGLISFVPYLGSTAGFLVAGGVAVAQYWPNYTQIAFILGIFVFGQVIEGNVLTPNIVGSKVRLHPVWLLFALIASGYLLGFTGLLISVPLAAAIGVLVRYVVRQYYNSSMYSGKTDHEPNVPAANA